MRREADRAQKECARWAHPEGARVCYRKDDGSGVETRTRSMASVMGGSAVIWLEGVTGCVLLERVTPLPEAKP